MDALHKIELYFARIPRTNTSYIVEFPNSDFTQLLSQTPNPPLLMFFANLIPDTQDEITALVIGVKDTVKEYKDYDYIINHIHNLRSEVTTIKDYLLKLYNIFANKYGKIIADIILMNSINNHHLSRFQSVDDIASHLREEFSSICHLARKFANFSFQAASLNPEVNTNESNILFYNNLNGVIGHTYDHVTYSTSDAICDDGKPTIVDVYGISDSKTLIQFELIDIIRRDISIRKCQHCNRFFIPSSRSDEIYCDYKHPNGRTCKQMGYEAKVNSDEILKTYRRVYKTQHARKQRNKKNHPTIEESFVEWESSAKTALKKCQNGEITVTELEETISSDSWFKSKKRSN